MFLKPSITELWQEILQCTGTEATRKLERFSEFLWCLFKHFFSIFFLERLFGFVRSPPKYTFNSLCKCVLECLWIWFYLWVEFSQRKMLVSSWLPQVQLPQSFTDYCRHGRDPVNKPPLCWNMTHHSCFLETTQTGHLTSHNIFPLHCPPVGCMQLCKKRVIDRINQTTVLQW